MTPEQSIAHFNTIWEGGYFEGDPLDPMAPDPELRDHANVASGICLSLTTSGRPVVARVRAFFVENSDSLSGEEFEAAKKAHLNEIGVRPIKNLDSLIPADQRQSTLAFLSEHKPIAGFSSSPDEILEA